MVSCNEFLTEFGNYLEGDSGEELRVELEKHLAQCSTCRVIVDSTRKTLKIVTETAELDLSESLTETLVARIMQSVRREPPAACGADTEV